MSYKSTTKCYKNIITQYQREEMCLVQIPNDYNFIRVKERKKKTNQNP